MKNLVPELFALTLVAGFAPLASADILFDNGAPTDGGSYFYADGSNPAGITASGNVFTATKSGTALSIDFGGNYAVEIPSSDTFIINLYTVNGSDVPIAASVISSGLTEVSRNGIVANGIGAYEFSGNLSTPFALADGTSYFLNISDDTKTPPTVNQENFAVLTSDGSDPLYQTENGNLTFIVNQSLSFSLFDTDIPEPRVDAMLLLGCGLLGFAFRRRLSGV